MTTVVPTSPEDQYAGYAGDAAEEEENHAPRADCVADSAGGLTFDVTDLGGTGAAHLLLRRREDHDFADAVRLPLTPSGEHRLRAALPSCVRLAEGRWDAFVETSDDAPQRLAPGLNDLRSLVDRVPGGAHGHVAVRIPYATKHGNLTVRSWWRAPHAEAGELLIDETGLTVRGSVHGTALTSAVHGELAARHTPGLVLRAAATADGDAFSCTVAFAALAAADGPQVWDLWLRPAGEDGPRVRVARLLDDVADKKAIFTYPTTVLTGIGTGTGTGTAGRVEAGPYYTASNDLSVRIAAAD